MDNLYTLTTYSGHEIISQMMHLNKEEAKRHKKALKKMVKGQIKKVSIKMEVER